MLKFHALQVAEVHRETDEAVRVAFCVPESLADAYRFSHGQHLNLRARVGAEELRRSYSICSAPGEGELAIVVKRIAEGRFSAWANDALRAGDRIDVMTPTGHFNTALDPANGKTYAAFAAGVGITPIISMIKATLAAEPRSRFILFYGNRNVASIIFRETIEDLKNRYMERFSRHHVLSRETQDAAIYNGRIDGERARALFRAFCPGGADECYVCGPASMIDEVTAALRDEGMADGHVHFERFTTAAVRKAAPAPAAEPAPRAAGNGQAAVTVVMDGRRTEIAVDPDGPGIVDAALAQGVELPFSCKSGVCSTCRAKVVEGEVRMDANYALEPWELEAGYVLACQSHPLSARVTLDYDT